MIARRPNGLLQEGDKAIDRLAAIVSDVEDARALVSSRRAIQGAHDAGDDVVDVSEIALERATSIERGPASQP